MRRCGVPCGGGGFGSDGGANSAQPAQQIATDYFVSNIATGSGYNFQKAVIRPTSF